MNTHPSTYGKKQAIVLFVLISIVIVGIAIFIPLKELVQAKPSEPTPNQSNMSLKYQDILGHMRESLAQYHGKPEDRKFFEANLKYMERQATRAADLSGIATSNVVWATEYARTTLTPRPTIMGQLLTGIINDISPTSQRGEGLIRMKNAWCERLNGQVVIVTAGALFKDPTQGILRVQVSSSGGTIQEKVNYLAPFKTGELTIIDVQNVRLVLSAETGETLYFDVTTREFSASLENWVPLPAPILETPEPGLSAQSLPLSELTPGPDPYP